MAANPSRSFVCLTGRNPVDYAFSFHSTLSEYQCDDDYGMEPPFAQFLAMVPHLDVDSDNFVAPFDALVVIDFLNSQSSKQGESESVNTVAPFEFIDDYFSNLATNKGSAASAAPYKVAPWSRIYPSIHPYSV